uniref:Uncharacterized protein n=1 Tax=Siphoviridae sp. ctnFo11 TaxID=2826454 RepID=A0A8S5N4M4_9CAUD|nr:MAG TPA: hypothetical protein [Siphoviridae sp. ctnFo11]
MTIFYISQKGITSKRKDLEPIRIKGAPGFFRRK